MPENIYEAITLWIALGNSKEEFGRELTPELEAFWEEIESQIKVIEAQGLGVDIPSFGI